MKQHKTIDSSFDSIDFLIHECLVAVYGRNIRESSNNFMRSLNSEYWEHILKLAHSVPYEEWNHDHVSFLRQCLSQAEEQLFALIFAYPQAESPTNISTETIDTDHERVTYTIPATYTQRFFRTVVEVD